MIKSEYQKRSAIVSIETSLNQEEFEAWFLNLMKAIVANPKEVSVSSVEDTD